MRVLALTRYSRLGASTRLRTLQYIPALECAGLQIRVAPFFDDAYVTDLYSSRRNFYPILRYYRRRIKQMLAARDVDLIWIEKEALPWIPWVFERGLLPAGVPYAVDYDDPVFYRYNLHRNSFIRLALGSKIDSVMAGAACVMVGNEYLAKRAIESGARRIEHVPTVVDMDRYFVKLPSSGNSMVRVGWIGTPRTWKGSAEPIYEEIKSILSLKQACFRAIGAQLGKVQASDLEVFEWKEETEVSEIQNFDIGIMPLPDDPWTRGKCGYKLIQYMACGLPVVASPIGVNTSIVQHGVNGFLAETPDEWRSAVSTLIEQPELRRKMGAEGRKLAIAQYSLSSWSPRLLNILTSACVKDYCAVDS